MEVDKQNKLYEILNSSDSNKYNPKKNKAR